MKNPRPADSYRAERRNGRRKLGGLARKTRPSALPPLQPNTQKWKWQRAVPRPS